MLVALSSHGLFLFIRVLLKSLFAATFGLIISTNVLDLE